MRFPCFSSTWLVRRAAVFQLAGWQLKNKPTYTPTVTLSRR